MRVLTLFAMLLCFSCTDWDLPEERPVASVLSVRSVTDSSVSLVWTSAESRNFASYYLYKGEGSVVDTTDELVDTLIFIEDTTYTVTDLTADTPYSFRVITGGVNGSGSVSNTVEARTAVDINSSALKLHTPDSTEITDHSVHLRWSRDWNWNESVEYRIYMDSVSPVDSLDSLVAKVKSVEKVLITGLERKKEYHFRVFLMDKGDAKAGSNTEKVITKSGEPKAVTIVDTISVTDESVSLRFSSSTDDDFAYYCLWHDREGGVDSIEILDTNSSHATVVHDIKDTTVTAMNLSDETKYHFSLYVVDSSGLFTPSKVYSVETKDSLFNRFDASAESVTDTTLTLTWDKYERNDFVQYEIYSGDTPHIDTNSTLLSVVANIAGTSFPVSGLTPLKQHFFRVYVRGAGGIVMNSDVVNNYSSILENLAVTAESVPLIWRSVVSLSGYDRVKLYRSVQPIIDDKLIPLKEFGSDASSYIDTAAPAGVNYYRLYYYTGGVKTGESNCIELTVPTGAAE